MCTANDWPARGTLFSNAINRGKVEVYNRCNFLDSKHSVVGLIINTHNKMKTLTYIYNLNQQ